MLNLRRGGLRGGAVAAATGLLLCGGCLSTGSSDQTYDIGDNLPEIGLAFGDSISHGRDSLYALAIDDAGPDEPGYRVKLEELFAADGRTLRMREDGVPGSVSAQGAARIEATLGATTPAFAVVLYGTNDAFMDSPSAELIRNLRSIVEECRRNKSIVVLCTLPPTCGLDAQRERIREYNPQIRDLAAALDAALEGVFLADLALAFESAAEDSCDLINPENGVHPTREGYELIATTVHDRLRDVTW